MADNALYDILGVSTKATDTELKKVYYILKSGKFHLVIFKFKNMSLHLKLSPY